MIDMHEYHDRRRWTTPYLTMSRQDDMIWCEDALHLILPSDPCFSRAKTPIDSFFFWICAVMEREEHVPPSVKFVWNTAAGKDNARFLAAMNTLLRVAPRGLVILLEDSGLWHPSWRRALRNADLPVHPNILYMLVDCEDEDRPQRLTPLRRGPIEPEPDPVEPGSLMEGLLFEI